jgi:hypothetical protein
MIPDASDSVDDILFRIERLAYEAGLNCKECRGYTDEIKSLATHLRKRFNGNES